MTRHAVLEAVTLRSIRGHTNRGEPLEFVDTLGSTHRLTYARGADLPYRSQRVGASQERKFSRLSDLRAHLENPA